MLHCHHHACDLRDMQQPMLLATAPLVVLGQLPDARVEQHARVLHCFTQRAAADTVWLCR